MSWDQGPIEITDSEIDPEQIMDEIRSQLNQSRMDVNQKQRTLPSFRGAVYPQKPDDIVYDITFYEILDEINQVKRQTGTTLDIRESSINRIPLIGRLWQKLQIQLHRPALFYANRAADRQAELNAQLVEILNKLYAANQEQQREINSLKDALKQFRQTDQ